MRRIKDQEPRQCTFTRLVKSSVPKLLSSESKLLDHSVSSPLCSCLQHDVPCRTVAFPCQHDFKEGHGPEALVCMWTVSHIFTATVDIWAEPPPMASMQGMLHKNFQQAKFSAESNQPALKHGHSSVAPQCWHLGISTADHAKQSWPAPFRMEQPTGFLLIAGVHAYYEKTLWKNIWKADFQCNSVVFQQNILGFQNLRVQRKKFKDCCLRRRAWEAVHSPKTLSLLLIVGTVSPSASGLSSSSHVKGRCCTRTRQKGSTPFLSNCDSSPDFPTAEDKTRLKSPPDPSTVEIRLIFLWGQSSDCVCR